ncbi:MAG: metalloregulator ArsR/SmtB family transcription factor [Planctomycetaceae bacterium]
MTDPHQADANPEQKAAQDGAESTSNPPARPNSMYANVLEKPSDALASDFPEISEKLEKNLVEVFKLLADETRLKVLFMLIREGELHVSALCDRLSQSQPAVSHHLALLRVAGLIQARRDGKHNFYSVRNERFHALMSELFSAITQESNLESIRFEDFLIAKN